MVPFAEIKPAKIFVPCPDCGMKIRIGHKSYGNLAAHRYLKHGIRSDGLHVLECGICDYGHVEAYALERHMTSVHDPTNKPYECRRGCTQVSVAP